MAFHKRHAAFSTLELTVSKFTSQNVHERLIINASMEYRDYPETIIHARSVLTSGVQMNYLYKAILLIVR